MDIIDNERYMLQVLVKGTNKKQNINILRNFNKNQYNILKQISKNILEGKISINKKQYKYLEKHKLFIRCLAYKNVSKENLIKKYEVVKEIILIGLDYYEINAKISFSSNRGMGKNKKHQSEEQPESNKFRTESNENNRNSESSFSSNYSSEEECDRERESKEQGQFS